MSDLRKVHALLAVLLLAGLGACASSPPDDPPAEPSTDPGAIEIHHAKPAVSGNVFHCTGTWPSTWYPCGEQPKTYVAAMTADAVDLTLSSLPMPIDGGASTVALKFKFDPAGTISASAVESTTLAPRFNIWETSNATAGFVDPTVVGRSPDARNAGAFSLTFPWGSISGTYDTAQ
jgi:hypothetical protein